MDKLDIKILSGKATYEESREYLTREGLDPDEIGRQGVVFVRTLVGKINAEKQIVELQAEIKRLTSSAAKKICYCGSLRFIDKFKEVEYQSVIDGNIALLPCCMFVDIQREYGAESDYKQKADDLHKRKIDICDEVFVLNVGGYIGESTRSEIDYALSIGKPVNYLEP